MMKSKSPCFECTIHTWDCHIRCAIYREWQIENERVREEIWAAKEQNRIATDFELDRSKRIRRRQKAVSIEKRKKGIL